ncbi:MAG: NADP-dependent oxidoreductase [Hamadaea sp.]|uniref:NADP-dependent oxidoreductase n=1 Tax=Hamadaea sp. TaxID=2024425 RepID=UPI00180A6386|nr:NADP-dependent oxidoreductase [Hamadaea sp.]NUR73910.1 NADP-dependent oxidoreductase [Hamadaea sp.]NUT19615.1 NADP-dependent oxidoreductase [Hamadaea sp.]
MRAVVFDRFGPPEVLRLAELPDPAAGPGHLRVRVRAAGVQPFDVAVRTGRMPWVQASFPQQIGQEYAGIVDQVGEGVTGWAVGDEVLGSAMLNAVADYVVVPAENAVRKPAELDFPSAAALVAAAQTASGALGELKVAAGETLLVHAAAGSVGTIAVQLARQTGATVVGTASPANHDYLRSLGAVPVAYGDGLVERVRAVAPQGVDAALDAAGRGAIAASVELVADKERIGTIVDDAAAAEFGTRVVRAGRSPQRLAEVVALAATGRILLPVRAYTVDEIAAAHQAVESGHGRGKVVVTL